MKHVILILAASFMTALNIVHAQKADSLYNPCDTLIKKADFNAIIRGQFSKVIGGGSDFNIGNFLSLDVNNLTVDFKATMAGKKGPLFTLGVNGGVDAGIISIFSNSQLSSNLGINGSLHFLTKKNSFTITEKECKKIITRIDEVIQNYDHLLRQDSVIFIMDSLNFLSKLECEKDSCLTLYNKKKIVLLPDIFATRRDSLNIRKENAIKERDKTLENLYSFNPSGFSISWWSTKLNLQNRNFKLYDRTKDTIFENQISSVNKTVVSFGLFYNIYKWSKRDEHSYYFNAGINISYDDNFSELSKIEIKDTYSATNPNVKREIVKNTTAYSGNYTDGIVSYNPTVNFYYFTLENKAAIHLAIDLFAKDIKAATVTPVVGFLLPLIVKNKDADKSTSKLNAEIFFQLNDIGNNLGTTGKIYERSNIGLRIISPITFL